MRVKEGLTTGGAETMDLGRQVQLLLKEQSDVMEVRAASPAGSAGPITADDVVTQNLVVFKNIEVRAAEEQHGERGRSLMTRAGDAGPQPAAGGRGAPADHRA
jgi:hypothetical protein